MWSLFTRLGEKIGVVNPIPVLNNPETASGERLSSSPLSPPSQKLIAQYQKALEKQQEVIEKMDNENIKFSRIIAAISLSIGIVLGGSGVSVVNQVSPDNFVQKVSSKVAKLLGVETTTHDYFIQTQKKDVLLTEQKNTLDIYKQLASAQGELLKAKDIQLSLFAEKFQDFSGEIQEIKSNIDSCVRSPGLGDREKKSSDSLDSHISISVLEKVKNYISSLNQVKTGPYQIKFSQNNAERVLVWIEGNGKRSLGYYADSPKYTHRLSLEGVRKWANQTIGDMEHVDFIYQIAQQKGILKDNTQNQVFSILIQPQYAGGVKVILKDNMSKKEASFYSNTADSENVILNKIDTLAQGLLS